MIKKLSGFVVIAAFLLIGKVSVGQSDIVKNLNAQTKTGHYCLLELRLNKEDEYKTFEGGKSSMARIALYGGTMEGAVQLHKVLMA